MLKRIKYLNEETKHVLVMSERSNGAWAVQNGYSSELFEVEQAYNEQWYLAGYVPTITTEELSEKVRAERDARITACDWIISRHAEQVALGVDTTLTSDEYAAWLGYRQELRDFPSVEGFPWDGGGADDEGCPWPNEPVCDGAADIVL